MKLLNKLKEFNITKDGGEKQFDDLAECKPSA